MIRIVAQTLLGFPVLLLGMLAWPFLAIPFVLAFSLGEATAEQIRSGLFLAAGAYGCLALPFSIAIPARVVRGKRWLKYAFAACLCGGSIVSISALSDIHQYPWRGDKFFSNLWMFGGPLIVALWNLWRYFRREPNQALQTTPVTRSEI